MAVISKTALGFFSELVSLLHGGVASGLKLVNNLFTAGFKMMMQYDEASMAFSRKAGLSAKQAQAYTEVLTRRAKELGERYGIAAEEVAKLEQNLARATGRVIMLSEAQADRQIQINRTVGEETANMFAESMMRTMGAQVGVVQGAVSKAYAIAARKGLDAAGMAAKVGQNLGMANRLNFRNGIEGLTKMVALSEKFGFNVSEIENVANKFWDISDAIENSAKLSMLGGPMGALGGNPLEMTYLANANPEELGNKITEMLGGYAFFDAEKGMSKIAPFTQDMIKQFASAVGMSYEAAVGTAKKQAEIAFKKKSFGDDIKRLTGGNKDMEDYLLNNAQYNTKTRKLEMTDRNGRTQDLDYFTHGAGKIELEERMRFSNMSDDELMRKQAESTISLNDKINGWITSLTAIMAEKIAPFLDQIKTFLGELYAIVSPHFEDIANNIKSLMESFFTKENLERVTSGIKFLVDFLASIGKFFTSSWWMFLPAAVATPILGGIAHLTSVIATRMGAPGGVGANAPASAGGRAAARAARNGSGWSGSRMSNIYNGARSHGYSRIGAATIAGKAAPKLARAMGGAASMGVGLIGMGISSYGEHKVESGEWEEGSAKANAASIAGGTLEWGAMGAGIGSMIAPGIGTAVGAGIGAIIGLAKGVYDANDAVKRKEARDEDLANARSNPFAAQPKQSFDEGMYAGIVGGKDNATSKEFVENIEGVVGIHKNEKVLNQKQMISANAGFADLSEVIAKPTGGEKTQVYGFGNTTTTVNNGYKITVDTINVRLGGTIKLDMGNYTADIGQTLIDNIKFKKAVVDMISEEIRKKTDLKQKNDTSIGTGNIAPSTDIGHMRIGSY